MNKNLKKTRGLRPGQRARAKTATYCFHCGTMLHERLAHQKACNEHLPLLKGELPEPGLQPLISQSEASEGLLTESVAPASFRKEARRRVSRQAVRRCRDCGGTLPPQRYFKCDYCVAPEFVEDDLGADWDHVEGL